MRKNISKVIKAFKIGKSLGCNNKTATCSTDGDSIYSYNMKICWLALSGIYVLSEDLAPSITTKRHIRACVQAFSNAIVVDSNYRF